MTPADLDRIEAAVGFILPPEYRQLAQEFPFQAAGNDSVYWFFNDANQVIGETQFPLEDGDYNREGWKPGYLAIGYSAGGDIHVLDTTAPGLPVYLLSHETHAFEPTWATLPDFVREWQESVTQISQQQIEMNQAIADQKARITRGLWITAGILLACMMAPFVLWVIIKLFGNKP